MDEALPVRKPKRWQRLLLLLLPVLGGLLWYGPRALGYVNNHRAFLVPSGSMAPAILPGDRVIVDIGGGTPKRGEIWAFQRPNSVLIKRVIGLPGETIESRGGKVLIDGVECSEPYLATSSTTGLTTTRLGPGQYFMLGDARTTSADSRAWGPVLKQDLIGRADHCVWPTKRMGRLR